MFGTSNAFADVPASERDVLDAFGGRRPMALWVRMSL
jgi:hypothetical protein